MPKEPSGLIIMGFVAAVALLGIFAIAFLYRQRHFRYLRERQQLTLSYEQELLKTRLEIQEQTFRNISQEIHDNIGQILSLARLNVATMDISEPDLLPQKIADSEKLISKALQDLRSLSHGLSMDFVADLGLARAIGHELEMIRKSGNYETSLLTEGVPYSLDKQKELIIYRIMQESLNNIIKHAAAQKIIIYLLYRPEEFKLTITDNGKGFDLTPLNDKSSFGLGIPNMHNRAQLIGAGFLISSTLEKGTSVTITVPIGHATI
ncbi:MAG: histidine kinase [Bacteroidota bacterium]|nr:histidine kinase [Bacteroidota bacterium]